MNLDELAKTDPEALCARIADPAADYGLRVYGPYWIGLRWAPDRWWPTLRALLRCEKIGLRESALYALSGHDNIGGLEDGYSTRDWPRDVAPSIREEVLSVLDAMAADPGNAILQDIIAAMAKEIRTGKRWVEWDECSACGQEPCPTPDVCAAY